MGKRTRQNRKRRLFVRQEGLCAYCKTPAKLVTPVHGKTHDPDMFTFEHVWPMQRGGRTEYCNLIGVHQKCNLRQNEIFIHNEYAGQMCGGLVDWGDWREGDSYRRFQVVGPSGQSL